MQVMHWILFKGIRVKGAEYFSHHFSFFENHYHFPSTPQLCTTLCCSSRENPNKIHLQCMQRGKMWKHSFVCKPLYIYFIYLHYYIVAVCILKLSPAQSSHLSQLLSVLPSSCGDNATYLDVTGIHLRTTCLCPWRVTQVLTTGLRTLE